MCSWAANPPFRATVMWRVKVLSRPPGFRPGESTITKRRALAVIVDKLRQNIDACNDEAETLTVKKLTDDLIYNII